jgi:HK97 family phage prohead protease
VRRFVAVDDIDMTVNRSGDGRTVTAYIATFNTPYFVSDQEGRYDEIVDPTAFNRDLQRHGINDVQVLYNHGMTAWQTPSDQWSVPVGLPLEMKPDGRGLLTVTRYSNDQVLDAIKERAIRGMSFRAPVVSSRELPRSADGRRTILRTQFGRVKEYGPTPYPANNSAEILAVRSAILAADAADLSPEERAMRAEMLADLVALLRQTEPHLFGGPSADPEPQEQPPTAPASPAPVGPAIGPSVDVDEAELAYLRLANPKD